MILHLYHHIMILGQCRQENRCMYFTCKKNHKNSF
uniref:Uncharacterized protein n=1 Tax=Arundo donax TaxID=35708 RepID=A0A0A9C4E0_ARUDO